jgi:hypothetical protein
VLLAVREGHEDLLIGEVHRGEVGADRGEVGHTELGDALAHHGDELGRRTRLAHHEVEPRVTAPHRADERCEGIDCQRRERDEVERAEVELARGRDRGLDLDPVTQQLPGRSEERRAGGGEAGAPADAVEERDAQLGLEPQDALRERGLGHVQRRGRPGEAVVVDDGDDVLDLAEIHSESHRTGRKIVFDSRSGAVQALPHAQHAHLIVVGMGIGFLSGLRRVAPPSPPRSSMPSACPRFALGSRRRPPPHAGGGGAYRASGWSTAVAVSASCGACRPPSPERSPRSGSVPGRSSSSPSS